MKPRSMEEKISYLLFLMGFAGLVCTAALCIFVFHKAFREQAWTALEREADLVAAGCAQVDAPSQLETTRRTPPMPRPLRSTSPPGVARCSIASALSRRIGRRWS